MNLKFLFLFLCFLIISCDLPNEADVDCNGDSNGEAYNNACGECVGGNTGLLAEHNINLCGECYGPEVDQCIGCGTESAINYINTANPNCEEDCIDHDESLCVYDMCVDYLPENFQLQEGNSVYTSGKDGVLFSGISIGQAVNEGDRVKVKLFSDPNQILLVNVVIEKATDLEAM